VVSAVLSTSATATPLIATRPVCRTGMSLAGRENGGVYRRTLT
jgi:hypothetical protein